MERYKGPRIIPFYNCAMIKSEPSWQCGRRDIEEKREESIVQTAVDSCLTASNMPTNKLSSRNKRSHTRCDARGAFHHLNNDQYRECNHENYRIVDDFLNNLV